MPTVNTPPPCGRMEIDGLPTVGTWQLLNPPQPEPVWTISVVEHMPTEILGHQRLPSESETKAALAEARGRYHEWMKHHPGVKQDVHRVAQ